MKIRRANKIDRPGLKEARARRIRVKRARAKRARTLRTKIMRVRTNERVGAVRARTMRVWVVSAMRAMRADGIIRLGRVMQERVSLIHLW